MQNVEFNDRWIIFHSTPTILVKTICESDMLNNIFSTCSNVVIASVQIKAG